MAAAKEIRKRAKETLGISKLRPGQLQAIEAVVSGRRRARPPSSTRPSPRPGARS